MYEAAYAHPRGETTAARLALAAEEYGYDGIVVRNADAVGDLEAVREAADVVVVDGIEITADDPPEAAGHLGNVRSGSHTDYTVVAVAGRDRAITRFAVENDRVDVFVPVIPGVEGFDDAAARAARDHGVRVEFDLGVVLRTSGDRRVRALSDLRRIREIATYYDTPHLVSARAESHLHLRAPRELVAVGEKAGFDPEWIREGLREWGRLADRNRRRASAEFLEPGVQRGRYEEDDR